MHPDSRPYPPCSPIHILRVPCIGYGCSRRCALPKQKKKADTVLSVMNRDPGRASILGTLRNIIEEQGIGGLFLGLQSRIVWSGAIISGQFLLYDVCKTALHVSADDLKVFLDVIASVEL